MHDRRHGGPFDRGAADSYYRRGIQPHYYEGQAILSPRVTKENMTNEEIEEYMAGYMANERAGDFKEWD